jgi:hypothetical protein
MAENPGVENSSKFPYYKPKRIEALQAIRKLVVDGYSTQEIINRLQLPERTYHRYLRQVFDYDREVLASRIPKEEVMDQLAILKHRFTQLYRQCQELATDSEADDMARLKAMQLAGEFAIAVTKLHQEAPVILMQCKELPYNMRQLQQQQQQQNQNQQQGHKSQLQQQQPEDEEEIINNDEIDEDEDEEEIDDDELLKEQLQQQPRPIIKTILGTDIRQYSNRELEDGFCYRYFNGKKVNVDLSDLQAEYFRKRGFSD